MKSFPGQNISGVLDGEVACVCYRGTENSNKWGAPLGMIAASTAEHN